MHNLIYLPPGWAFVLLSIDKDNSCADYINHSVAIWYFSDTYTATFSHTFLPHPSNVFVNIHFSIPIHFYFYTHSYMYMRLHCLLPFLRFLRRHKSTVCACVCCQHGADDRSFYASVAAQLAPYLFIVACLARIHYNLLVERTNCWYVDSYTQTYRVGFFLLLCHLRKNTDTHAE